MNNLTVSSSPHLHARESVPAIMWTVVACLIPAGAVGVYVFGIAALWTIILSCAAALATELLLQAAMKKKVAVLDGSALLTGLLLAYNLPPRVPFWLPIVGACFSIAIGKQVFGGLGQNIFNPALVGRAFLMASWPHYMTSFLKPFDTVTSATPLALLKEGKPFPAISYLDLFWGHHGGCIGEVGIAALLAGALFLLLRGYITLTIPLSFIGTTALATFIAGPQGLFSGDGMFQVLSGGLILGAFFMATDYVTSPLTVKGQVLFGTGCGILTAVIRLWGGYPEGVCYSILMMNAATPLIDRYTRPRIYGTATIRKTT